MIAMLRAFAALLLLTAGLRSADIGGIWMGMTEGRNGEKQDIAFRFRQTSNGFSGVLFGDEFDLPLEGLTIDGDHLSFFVTNTDYRDRKKTKTAFEGTIAADGTIALTRERPGAAAAATPPAKQTIVLKKLARASAQDRPDATSKSSGRPASAGASSSGSK